MPDGHQPDLKRLLPRGGAAIIACIVASFAIGAGLGFVVAKPDQPLPVPAAPPAQAPRANQPLTAGPQVRADAAPSFNDRVLLASCREYEKLKRGKKANRIAAQACWSFQSGYAMGWSDHQNAPQTVAQERVCVANFDALIRQYLTDRATGRFKAPSPSLAAEMITHFKCKPAA